MQKSASIKNHICYSAYKPGALANVVSMHMDYYSKSWGFGLAFETKVASELSEFLIRFNPTADLFLMAYEEKGKCVGSISLDSKNVADKRAHVRWFIVDQNFSGHGIGKELMNRVVEHCDKSGFPRSYLTTFDGLHAARKLYESVGYALKSESNADQWQAGVKEQLFIRQLSP